MSKWPDQFVGEYFPRSDYDEKYYNWKIPAITSLVNPPHTSKDIQRQCMSHMLRAANALAGAMPEEEKGYYKVACLFVLPWMISSEVTIFYDPEYYMRFFGEEHYLIPRKLSEEYGFSVPLGFVERGYRVIDEENSIDEEWWCIGQHL